MLKVGLTGGIGSGKSSVSDIFLSLNIKVIDADKIAREIVEPGQPALTELVEHFGNEILDSTGALDRKKLRAYVFNNQQELEWLNNCLHPKVRAEMLAQADSSIGDYVVFDIPLLFENKLQTLVDEIIVVDISTQLQIERVTSRDDVTKSDVQAIIDRQVSREYRLLHADYVIDNSGTFDKLKPQVIELDRQFRKQVISDNN